MGTGSVDNAPSAGDSPRERLSRHVARVMAQQPHPPRRVSTIDLLPYTIVLPGEARRVRTGLLLLAGVAVAALAVGWAPVRLALAVVGLPPALLMATGPLRLAFRIGWAARYGVMASAVVADQVDEETVCQIQGPRGPFQAVVEFDDLPAPEPADRLLVIVHPEEDEVLWSLGSPGG